MCSPLSLVVANLFMEDIEKKAFLSALLKPSVFLRYGDNMFVVWPHGKQTLVNFLQHFNS